MPLTFVKEKKKQKHCLTPCFGQNVPKIRHGAWMFPKIRCAGMLFALCTTKSIYEVNDCTCRQKLCSRAKCRLCGTTSIPKVGFNWVFVQSPGHEVFFFINSFVEYSFFSFELSSQFMKGFQSDVYWLQINPAGSTLTVQSLVFFVDKSAAWKTCEYCWDDAVDNSDLHPNGGLRWSGEDEHGRASERYNPICATSMT